MAQSSKWYKNQQNDNVWWLDNNEEVGKHIFSFDKKESFNLFSDYPWKLTKEQKKMFDEENPFWADFFSDRSV
jgi:hypothetical protein